LPSKHLPSITHERVEEGAKRKPILVLTATTLPRLEGSGRCRLPTDRHAQAVGYYELFHNALVPPPVFDAERKRTG
jgi:hypothetical protein